MKYARKHPDILIIANYADSRRRVRHGRQTSPQELSQILVRTLVSKLRGKKVLLLTDAPEEQKQKKFIMRTCWDMNRPLSLRSLFSRLIYNHQTHSLCIMYHPRLFGAFTTILLAPILLAILRMAGKRITIVFLTTPTVSTQPKLIQTLRYFIHVFVQSLLTRIAQVSITSEKSRATGSLKKRSEIGNMIVENLFVSPLAHLGILAS